MILLLISDYYNDVIRTKPISKYISENSKTVVVPTVTSLDPNTWIETRTPPGSSNIYCSCIHYYHDTADV